MYLLDVGKEKPNLSEHDTIMAEDIIYNRDLIRIYIKSNDYDSVFQVYEWNTWEIR